LEKNGNFVNIFGTIFLFELTTRRYNERVQISPGVAADISACNSRAKDVSCGTIQLSKMAKPSGAAGAASRKRLSASMSWAGSLRRCFRWQPGRHEHEDAADNWLSSPEPSGYKKIRG
jgi:hypothetical protein